MNKLDEMMHLKRLQELIGKKEEEKKKECSPIWWILAVAGAIAIIAAIAYAAYRYFTPDYLEDFEDDFDDDFDDDFFEDEDEEKEESEAPAGE